MLGWMLALLGDGRRGPNAARNLAWEAADRQLRVMVTGTDTDTDTDTAVTLRY
jgi:hypothetical protein